MLNYVVKNFSDIYQVFRILHHYTWGAFFRGHAAISHTKRLSRIPSGLPNVAMGET